MGACKSKAQGKDYEAPKEVKSDAPSTVSAKELHDTLKQPNSKADGVRELLSRTIGGVEIEEDDTGNRPLHTVARAGNLELLKLFVEYKADVNAMNKDGDTPLHLALGYDHFDCAIQLKISGADDCIENAKGIPARLGSDGNKSYGVAAIASSTTVKQLDIAFKICDSSVADINEGALVEASDKAREAIGNKWTEEYSKKLATLIAQFHQDDVKVAMDDSKLTCIPKGGIRTLLQCNGI